MTFFGLLNIHKPPGLSSRHVVDAVVKLVRPAKAGHAGTLDPLAAGVLIVCVGPATRLVPFVQELPKTYHATFLLGRTSNTDDIEGEVVDSEMPAAGITRQQVESLLPRFIGRIEQVPPRFSAVHVGGRRAYKLARQGRDVELAARTVEVHRIDLVRFDAPQLELKIVCGSGTYVRAIGRDLGELLGCGALMSALVRTRIGPFTISAALPLDELNSETLPASLLPAVSALPTLPKYPCDADELTAIRCGRTIPCRANAGASPHDGDMLALLTGTGVLAALATYRSSDGTLAPSMVFCNSPSGA